MADEERGGVKALPADSNEAHPAVQRAKALTDTGLAGLSIGKQALRSAQAEAVRTFVVV